MLTSPPTLRYGVRRESVHLEVTGDFVADMAAAAGSVAVLRRELDGLGRTRINTTVNNSINQLSRDARGADSSINQLTGRLSLFADAALILGPGLVPIAAVGSQAIGGLATSVAALAVAGGSAIVAFQGLGDAVKAVDAYQLDPTVRNLEKAQEAMAKLGPDAQVFVAQFQKLQPELTKIQRAAARGWFPGLTESLDDFATFAPQVARLMRVVGMEGGAITRDIAGSLASGRWDEFMRFLTREAPAAMASLARTTGDLVHGLAGLWMAFDPGNDRFLGWLEKVARGFDRWANSAEGAEDIKAFLEYARQNGPEVEKFFLALVDATAQIVKAAAPLGGPTLTTLTKLLEVVAQVADSDLASPFLTGLVALRLYTRGLMVAQAAQARLMATSVGGAAAAGTSSAYGGAPGTATAIPFVGATTTATVNQSILAQQAAAQRAAQRAAYLRGGLQASAALTAVAAASTGLTDGMEDANAASLTLMGTMIAPGWGTAAGAIAGSFLDMAAANDAFMASYERTMAAIDSGDAAGAKAALRIQQAEYERRLKDQYDVDHSLMDPFGLKDQGEDAYQTVKGLFGESDADKNKRLLDETSGSLFNLNANAMSTDFALGAVGAAFTKTAPPVRELTTLLDGFSKGLQQAQGFLSRNGSIDAYHASVDALAASIKENGKAFDKFSEKGRANRAALRGVAESGLAAAENLHGLNRVKFIDNLRKQFKQAADDLGLSEKQTDRWMRQLGLLNDVKAQPAIELAMRQFDMSYADAKRKLADLDGDTATSYLYMKRITQVSTVTAGSGPGGAGAGPGRANDGVGRIAVSTTSTDDPPRWTTPKGRMVASIDARTRGRGVEFPSYRGGSTGLDTSSEAVGASRGLRGLRGELEKTEKALGRERAQRQDMLAYRSEVGASLTGSLTGGGLAGFDLAVAAGTNDNRKAIRALIELKKKGLDGPLFDLVASSGDPALISEFANLNRRQIAQRERRYGQLTASQNRLGGLAVVGKYGESLAENAAAIKALEKQLKKLRKDVRDGAREGTRQGAAERDRKRDRETRTRTRSRG